MGVLHTNSGPVYTGSDAVASIKQALLEHRSPLVYHPHAREARTLNEQLEHAVRIIIEKGEDWPVARLTITRIREPRS